jgi:hypothetical protein
MRFTPLGERQINFLDSSTDGLVGTQADPAVTALSNGNFVVVYEDPASGNTANIDLLAHFFDAHGNAIAPPATTPLLNGVVGLDQSLDVTVHPAITATAGGGFVVAYSDITAGTIVAESYNPTTGISAPFTVFSKVGRVNTQLLDSASIGTFADGNMLVAWDEVLSATDHNVDDAILNPTATGFVVAPNSVTSFPTFQGQSRIATFGNTAALVYADDLGTINGGQDIFLNFINSTGTALAAPTSVFGTNSADVWSHPDVAALSDGRFAVVAEDDTTGAIAATIVDPTTHALTPWWVSPPSFPVSDPHVVAEPDGIVVSFEYNGSDVFGFNLLPPSTSGFIGVDGLVDSFTTGIQDENAIAVNANGSVFFAWRDAGSGNPNSSDADTRIEGQMFYRPPIIAADFDGNGTSDVALQNGGTIVDWIMNNGQFASGNVITTGATGYSVVGSGDFNGNGTSDLLLQNGGTVVDWIMSNGAYQIGNVLTSGVTGWTVVGAGDFNGDETSDVLLQNGGTVVDWIIQNGVYQSGNVITNGANGWTAVGTGDVNGDGTADVVLQNGGTVVDWIMRNGVYQSGNVLTNGAAGWTVVGTGDFNGDGTADVLLQNGGTVVDWIMGNGVYQSGNVITNGAIGWNVVGTGDYNGDGTSDVLLQNGGTVVDWTMKNGLFQSGNVITNGALGYTVARG